MGGSKHGLILQEVSQGFSVVATPLTCLLSWTNYVLFNILQSSPIGASIPVHPDPRGRQRGREAYKYHSADTVTRQDLLALVSSVKRFKYFRSVACPSLRGLTTLFSIGSCLPLSQRG
ncbi:hypothetical protein DPEC_G00020830 [Dallia pectoralis]|uniref:Uncharacterized protein n=1 Tax=Dallia pectoralis TaxID=75939 RepID=A0ACC2HGR1_DALPE|nr:hypothetical protein DPEC_G00020830 [Dallia pectoralis]